MGYKLPSLPSAQSYIEEKADFWEIQALSNGGNYFSQVSAAKALAPELDEIKNEGITDEDDELDDSLSDVYRELVERGKACISRYPFEFGKFSIRLDPNSNEDHKYIYIFLLLCTRFKMNSIGNKVRGGVDGTLLFEELCREVAQAYFGKNAKSLVFGTATAGNFEDKVKSLIKELGEGEGFKNPNNNYPTKNDDGIDVIVWKEFADQRMGKLIGFAQCKTGTSWPDEIKKLNPSHFCQNWLREMPIMPPIPIVFLCDTLIRNRNFATDQREKLVFNRFRIMQYLPEKVSQNVLDKISLWVKAALVDLN